MSRGHFRFPKGETGAYRRVRGKGLSYRRPCRMLCVNRPRERRHPLTRKQSWARPEGASRIFAARLSRRRKASDSNLLDKSDYRQRHGGRVVGNSPSDLIDRLNTRKCEACGDTAGPFEMHHLRRPGDLRSGSLMVWRRSGWRRKTIVLCPSCRATVSGREHTRMEIRVH